MGDFAAGKMIDGVQYVVASIEEFDQWIADCENKMRDKGFEDFQPVDAPNQASVQSMVAGTPGELLSHLLGWSNGGFSIFEYQIHSAAQILEDAATAEPATVLVIGRDLDDDVLLLNIEDGQLLTNAGPIGEDLAQWLGRFRFELCSNKLEWADAWVSC